MSRAAVAILTLAAGSGVAFLVSIGYLLAAVGEARAVAVAVVVGIFVSGLLTSAIAIEARRA